MDEFGRNKSLRKSVNKDKLQIVKYDNTQIHKFSSMMDMREFIRFNFSKFKWKPLVITNECKDKKNESDKPYKILDYTPTQDFVRNYFTPENPYKGLLLWHSVGTGKTCSAIATASTTYERMGYNILFVSRTTLINDIWKNMYNMVCSEDVKAKMKKDKIYPTGNYATDRRKFLSENWYPPIGYKTFSNALSGDNQFHYEMLRKSKAGEKDILHKTLLIIDEAHKLYGGDLKAGEKPDIKTIEKMINNSYKVSGKDSVKLLLMTATPITNDPMELIKLVNLMKDKDKLPLAQTFNDEYLEPNGSIRADKKEKLAIKIGPHISYLNRENDARNFAIPSFYPVPVYNNDEQMSYEDDPEYVKKNQDLINKMYFIQKDYETKVEKYEDKLKIIDKRIADYKESKNVDEITGEKIAKLKEKQNAIRLKIRGYKEKKDVLKPGSKNYEQRIKRYDDLSEKQRAMYYKTDEQIKKTQERSKKKKSTNTKQKLSEKKTKISKQINKSKEMRSKKIDVNKKSQGKLEKTL